VVPVIYATRRWGWLEELRYELGLPYHSIRIIQGISVLFSCAYSRLIIVFIIIVFIIIVFIILVFIIVLLESYYSLIKSYYFVSLGTLFGLTFTFPIVLSLS
jgi:hypothetical protein